MDQENKPPFGLVSALPRARTSTSIGGTKRSTTTAISGGDLSRRSSTLPVRKSVARRGTITSTGAPSVSSTTTAPRRQSEYLRNLEANSASSIRPGRLRPSSTFTATSTSSKSRLPVPKSFQTSKSSKLNEEAIRRQTIVEANQQAMKSQIDMLTQIVKSKKGSAPEVMKQERDTFRTKLDVVNAQLKATEKEITDKTRHLHEAKLDVKTVEIQLQQQSISKASDIEDCRRKAKLTEEDLLKWRNKYDDVKEVYDDLEKRHALERLELQAKVADVKRLEDDISTLQREQKTFEDERVRYKAEICRLEGKITKSETDRDRVSSVLVKLRTSISEQETAASDLTEQAASLKNQIDALRVQYEGTAVENEKRKAEIEDCRSNGSMSKSAFEEQLRDVNDEKVEMEAKYATQINTLEKSLGRAVESLLAVEKMAEANGKMLTVNAAEIARLLQDSNSMRARAETCDRLDQERVLQIQAMKEKIRKLEEQLREDEKDRRLLHNEVMELKGNIRVFCRMRPFLRGKQHPDEPSFALDKTDSLVAIPPSGFRTDDQMEFKFDYVFGPKAAQSDVFVEISQLVQSALDGYRVCIFAYGQTGSGKTHTMIGDESDENMGMIPRSVRQVFESASTLEMDGWKFQFSASFIEIYNETCRDLLRRGRGEKKLELKMDPKSDKVDVPGLITEEVGSTGKVLELIERANKNRATAATAANERSSRSHSVFQFHIVGTHEESGQTLQGALNLVDLAGSERLENSKVEGARLKETQAINKSLSALSGVIVKLSDPKSKHVPFRNSKLTTLLRESLVGRSKVLMFVNVSPEAASFQETVCSLRFARTVNSCHVGTAKKNSKVELS